MASYKIKGTLETTTHKTFERVVVADSAEDAKNKFDKKVAIKSNEKIIKLSAEEIEYKTTKWRDVEDVVLRLEDELEEAMRTSGFDSDSIDMYQQDLEDWEFILEKLIDKDFDSAAERYSSMDTASRENIPDRIYTLFDSLELI